MVKCHHAKTGIPKIEVGRLLMGLALSENLPDINKLPILQDKEAPVRGVA